MSLFNDNQDEAFKAAMHGAHLLLNAQLAAYNTIVYKKRGTPWHLISATIYASLVFLESIQVYRHVKCLRNEDCKEIKG